MISGIPCVFAGPFPQSPAVCEEMQVERLLVVDEFVEKRSGTVYNKSTNNVEVDQLTTNFARQSFDSKSVDLRKRGSITTASLSHSLDSDRKRIINSANLTPAERRLIGESNRLKNKNEIGTKCPTKKSQLASNSGLSRNVPSQISFANYEPEQKATVQKATSRVQPKQRVLLPQKLSLPQNLQHKIQHLSIPVEACSIPKRDILNLRTQLLIYFNTAGNSVYINASNTSVHKVHKLYDAIPGLNELWRDKDTYCAAVLHILIPVLYVGEKSEQCHLFMDNDRLKLFHNIISKIYDMDVSGLCYGNCQTMLVIGTKGSGTSLFLQVISTCVQLITNRVIAINTIMNKCAVYKKLPSALICDAYWSHTGIYLVNPAHCDDLSEVFRALRENNYRILLIIDDFHKMYQQPTDNATILFCQKFMLQLSLITQSDGGLVLLILAGNVMYLRRLTHGDATNTNSANSYHYYPMYKHLGGAYNLNNNKLTIYNLGPISNKDEFTRYLKSLNDKSAADIANSEGETEYLYLTTGGIRSSIVTALYDIADKYWEDWCSSDELKLNDVPTLKKHQALQIALVVAIVKRHKENNNKITAFSCMMKIPLREVTNILNLAKQHLFLSGISTEIAAIIGQFSYNDYDGLDNVNELLMACDEMSFSMNFTSNDIFEIGFALPYHFYKIQMEYSIC